MAVMLQELDVRLEQAILTDLVQVRVCTYVAVWHVLASCFSALPFMCVSSRLCLFVCLWNLSGICFENFFPFFMSILVVW